MSFNSSELELDIEFGTHYDFSFVEATTPTVNAHQHMAMLRTQLEKAQIVSLEKTKREITVIEKFITMIWEFVFKSQ